MLNAGGGWYEMNNGGHLMIIKSASQRLAPRLLVDSHTGYQARCERDPRARTGEGLWQASEIYTPLQAWQALGQPTIAINANFFDVRGQKGGSWKSTGCSSPLGAYVDNTRGQGRANAAVTGHRRLRGQAGPVRRQRALEGAVDDDPAGRRRAVRGAAEEPATTTTPPHRPSRVCSTRARGSSRSPASGCWPPATPASSTTAAPARPARRSRTPRTRTRCTSSRAAATPRTRSRICSAGSAATPRCCSTAAGRRRSCCAATPAACGRAPVHRAGRATPAQVLCDSARARAAELARVQLGRVVSRAPQCVARPRRRSGLAYPPPNSTTWASSG